jgi:PAS domain S-box-containing protein
VPPLSGATVHGRFSEEDLRRDAGELCEQVFNATSDGIVISHIEDGHIVAANDAFCRITGHPRHEVLGRTSMELGVWHDPADRDRLTSAILEHGAVTGLDIQGITRRGEVRDTEVSGQVIELSGRALFLFAVRDVTRRKLAERERDRLLQREHEARMRAEAVYAQLETLVSAAPVGIALVDRELSYLHTNRVLEEALPDHRRALRPLLGEVLETRAALVNVELDGRDGTWLGSISPVVHPVDGVLGIGVVIVDITERKRAETRLRDSEERMQRALEQLLRAEEDERERIATDLHDDTIQVMVATLYSLDRALRSAADEPDETVARIHAARGTLEDAIGRARGLAFELRPPLLETQGLGAAVRALAAYRASEAGFACRVTATAKRFPPATEVLAYRCVAEALANVAKHARAVNVGVRIGYRRGMLTIDVRDDGRGFRVERPLPRARAQFHLGLSVLRERVRLANGEMRIDTAPGEGTHLAIALPAEQRRS